MPNRESAPVGSPCWADLWTSDVEGSRRFYGELFGWEAQEPSPEFGGYFMFARNGVPVAGGMGDMGDMRANNSWKIYLSVDDAAKTVEAAEANGARVVAPAMAVADLGVQAVLDRPDRRRPSGSGSREASLVSPSSTSLARPTGSSCSRGTTSGPSSSTARFSAGTPHRERHRRVPLHDDESTRRRGSAGIMDAKAFLPEGAPAEWASTGGRDVDDAVAKAKALGGSVVMEAAGHSLWPYGGLADPAGAQFKLRQPPQ